MKGSITEAWNREQNVGRRRVGGGIGGAGFYQVVRAVKEIRLLFTLHPTHCRKQQMAQPQAAGRDSNLLVPAHPSPSTGDGEEQGKVRGPSQVEATP